MTKKQIIGEIKEKLNTLGIQKDGCVNIYSLLNVNWVGYTQILYRKHIHGALYKNHRAPLYSKEVSIYDLCSINKELEERINKMKGE